MNFPSQIFFNDTNHGYRTAILKKSFLWRLPFYMAVATYCYYEKVRRTRRTATVSYLLKKINPPISSFLSQNWLYLKKVDKLSFSVKKYGH